MVGMAYRQEIDTHRGPAGDYNKLNRPLPKPPKGKYWVHNTDTKEWLLADVEHVFQIGGDEELFVDAQIVDQRSDAPEEYFEHLVQEHDTFQGICLRYKVTPIELRQANGGFSGTNLHLAPNPLKILRKIVEAEEVTPLEETTAFKLSQLKKTCRGLSNSEAKCYLELNDGNLAEAISNAQEDGF